MLPLLPRYLGSRLLLCVPFHRRLVCEADASSPRRASSPLVGTPTPAFTQGNHWLSPVPESPLWIHAPLSDPGGVLNTRLGASRTAAFRPLHTVGFPSSTALRIILWTTTLHISGLHHAAYILVPSSFALPLLGVHVDFTSDLLAKLWSGGTCTSHGVHPLGNNNQFHGISPNSKVSGLPWHEQRLVRHGSKCSPPPQ